MTDLTEQWKKGELPEGLYYVENNEGNIGILGWVKFAGWYNVKQVLAEVPSYEEQEQLKEYERIVTSYNMKPIDYDIACETVNKLLDERKALKKGNAQLKELLKECRDVIKNVDTYYGNYDSTNGYLVINKIDEVLK